ncbi:MAG: response regulator [Bacteroidota bacterium]
MTQKAKILYIDDEQVNLLLFQINFSEYYEVLTGSDGKTGLEILEKNPDIRVVISDMKMPGMNGIEFIRSAAQRFQGIVFYILTGYDINEEISSALSSGLISGYFMKPFNLMEIRNGIDTVVG